MVKRVFAIASVSFLLVAAAAPLAAQTEKMTANIPFEFRVGDKDMPAGEYEVWKSPTSAMIVLRGLHQRTSVLSLAMSDQITSRNPAPDTRLIFNRYGDQHFLRAVVNAYRAIGFTLPEARAEREMAKTLALHQEQVPAVLARR